MMTREENDRLCRIGPGTPMGNVFRRFWNPVCLSTQLPEPDCAPLLVRHLGEDFVAFRDSDGRVGFLDELCMHRGASLVLGRVEGGGIRCIYHGWKFDATGAVTDIMNNPDQRVAARLKAKAYPVREAGGMIWVYLGPTEKQPPFPELGFMKLPPENMVVMRVDINANWVQTVEGGLDSSHVSVLHSNAARPSWNGSTDQKVGLMAHAAPSFESENTNFGSHYCAIRSDENGVPTNARIVPFFMPSGRIIPDFRGTTNATMVLEVPIDDENTSTFSIRYGEKPIPRMSRVVESGYDDPQMYSEAETRVLFDRKDFFRTQKREQMNKTWSGLRGIALEDAVINVSQGPLYDRSQEHLLAADLAVVRFRRIMLTSAELVEKGGDPIGADADYADVTAIDAPLPKNDHWRVLVPSHKVARELA